MARSATPSRRLLPALPLLAMAARTALRPRMLPRLLLPSLPLLRLPLLRHLLRPLLLLRRPLRPPAAVMVRTLARALLSSPLLPLLRPLLRPLLLPPRLPRLLAAATDKTRARAPIRSLRLPSRHLFSLPLHLTPTALLLRPPPLPPRRRRLLSLLYLKTPAPRPAMAATASRARVAPQALLPPLLAASSSRLASLSLPARLRPRSAPLTCCPSA